SAVPHWLIALLVLLPLFGLDVSGLIDELRLRRVYADRTLPFLYAATLFAPGAIKRFNGRHLLVMLLGAVAWQSLEALFPRWPMSLFPYSLALAAAIPVVIVGIGEWALTRRESWPSFWWVLVFGLTAG